MYKWRFVFQALPAVLFCAVCFSCSRTAPHFNPATLTASEKSCLDSVNAAHAQEEVAMSRKDIEGAMAECSPDFVGTRPDGRTENYAEIRQGVVSLFKVMDNMKETNSVQELHLSGNTAIITVKVHVEETLSFPNPLTGQPIKRAQDHIDKETWVEFPSGWLLIRSDILSST